LVQARRASEPTIQALSRVHVVFTRALQIDIAPQLAAAGVKAVMHYPKGENIDYMSAPPNYDRPSQPKRKQEDRDVYWGPLSSGRWAAEYKNWGLSRKWSSIELEYGSDSEVSD